MSKFVSISLISALFIGNNFSWADADNDQRSLIQRETEKLQQLIESTKPEQSEGKLSRETASDSSTIDKPKKENLKLRNSSPAQTIKQISPETKETTDSVTVKKNTQTEVSKEVESIQENIPEKKPPTETKQVTKQPEKIDIASQSFNDNKEKGLAIIKEVDRRDTGWHDIQSNLKMILRNRHGDEHSRTLKMKTMEVKDDGDKSLSIFNSPRDIKGTAFLSFTHALEPDEQWLYMPAIKRVKRISSKNKSGPYLGSEFAFEDLSSFEIPKYTYNYLRDEVYDGIDSFVIEAFPQYQHSGYTKLVLWIDKDRYILLKTDYYDRKNSLLKTQTFHGYQQYLGQYWRPDEMRMVNHLTGKSTVLLTRDYQFKKGLTKRSFDKNALKRAR